MICYGYITPHVTRERKYLEYFNDVMMMFLAYAMVCMTHFVLNSEIIFKMGYAFIILFGMLVAGNLMYIFYVLYTRYARQEVLS